MHGCPLCLGPYLGGEGMYQKSENMRSFQMTPSNYRYVISMWRKCLHWETAWQTKFARLAYKLVDKIIGTHVWSSTHNQHDYAHKMMKWLVACYCYTTSHQVGSKFIFLFEKANAWGCPRAKWSSTFKILQLKRLINKWYLLGRITSQINDFHQGNPNRNKLC